MKILLLSTKTGQGHNSAAYSIKKAFDSFSDVECKTADILSFRSKAVSQTVGDIYENIVVKAPSAFGAIYKAGQLVSNIHLNSPVYYANTLYAKRLDEYIHANNFDACVTTHLFAMEALSYIKRHSDSSLHCYGIFTDYAAIPFTRETDMDKYFIPHESIADDCIKQGMDSNKLIVSGIPVRDDFINHPTKEDARNVLGYDKDKKIFLVMSGGMGAGNVIEICKELLINSGRDTSVIVMTGRNTKLKLSIDRIFSRTKRLTSLGYTNNVALYMSAADVLLSKPGGLSSTEAAVFNIPLVHTPGIPGCETINADFFADRLMSLKAKSPAKAAELAQLLIDNVSLTEPMLNAQRKNCNPDAAHFICDYIVKEISHHGSV